MAIPVRAARGWPPAPGTNVGVFAMTASSELESAGTPLPESGWELRIARGARGSEDRPALEVHTGDGLIDVAVAGGRDEALVRGAVRGRRWSVAWGELPPGGEVLVEFRTGGSRRKASAITVAGAFWVAEVAERFREVTVTTAVDRKAYRLRRFRQRRGGRKVTPT
jgi:hypothetical protein